MKSNKDEKIGEALLKVALGYQIAEVTEEYAEVDGALKLTKRKKTKKDVPPDLKAVQMLLEGGGEEYSGWSDEDLEKEKARLIGVLGNALQAQKAGDVSKVTVSEGADAVKKSAVKKVTRKKSVVKKAAAKKKTTK